MLKINQQKYRPLPWAATTFFIISSYLFSNLVLSEEHSSSNSKQSEGEQQSGIVELKPGSEQLFKIELEALAKSAVSKQITAPGEVVLNSYKTAIVALRIDGQVIKRLAKMGDPVVKGQPLADISSIQMAQAQEDYVVNAKEWSRVKQLGKKVVSGKRFVEARAQWRSSRARLIALGLDTQQLIGLEKRQRPDGIFKAIAPIDGTVLSDDFIEGQFISAGGQLFVISDESKIWVEASVSPSQAALFSKGDLAMIEHDSESHLGKIIQIGHLVSESTRTQTIRIEIDNANDDLHPGQFVSATLSQQKTEDRLTVPESALVRTPDGDWGVFIEQQPRRFKLYEVELIRRQGNRMVIAGIAEGSPVVVQGAFYLSAELAKAGFDPHGH